MCALLRMARSIWGIDAKDATTAAAAAAAATTEKCAVLRSNNTHRFRLPVPVHSRGGMIYDLFFVYYSKKRQLDVVGRAAQKMMFSHG